MNYFKYIRHHAMIGIMVSALLTMLVPVLTWRALVITPTEIVAVLIMGLIIGELALIIDMEFVTFTIRLLIHMILTFGVVFVFDYYFKSITFLKAHPVTFVIEYIVIYALVWILVNLSTKNDINSINTQLRLKRQKQVDKTE